MKPGLFTKSRGIIEKKFFTVIFLILSGLCHSQSIEKIIDSLQQKLPGALNDSTKVELLRNISWYYRRIDMDKAVEYAKKCFNQAQESNNKYCMGQAYVNFAFCFYSQGNYSKAENFFLEGLKYFDKEKHKKLIAYIFSNLANVYGDQSDYNKSIDFCFKALTLLEEIKDTVGIGQNLVNIGTTYQELQQNEKALEYYLKALAICEKQTDKNAFAICLSNIGSILLLQKKNEEAMNYFNKALNIREEMSDFKGIAQTYYQIGSSLQEQEHFDLALEYLFKAVAMGEKLNDVPWLSSYYLTIGKIYTHTKKFDAAVKYLNKGLYLSKQVNSKWGAKECYEELGKTYAEMGKDYSPSYFKNAYENYKQYSLTKDSIYNEESNKQIVEMQTKYETEKKEQQITLLNKDKELQNAQLNRQKIIIWSVAGGLLVVLILSIFIFRERRKSEKLLLNILPVETAKELKSKGKASPKHYESVTVMFTDFKGFTTLAEKMSAEELVGELDFIFKKYDEIISKYPIEKIKTIGDSYMCAGGLPVVNKSNPMDVVLAALEIQKFMEEYNKKERGKRGRGESENSQTPTFSLSHFPHFEVRIGIHTGPVIAGVVGDKKFAYDIWGDTVNVASRMESSGEAGKVNISGDTYRTLKSFSDDSHPSLFRRGAGGEVKECLHFTYRGKIPAKNKGEVEMYFVEQV